MTANDKYLMDKLRHIPVNVKVAFGAALVFSLLVHGFAFLHKFVNEDSLYHFHSSLDYLYQSGRWALVFLQHIRGFYVAPWVIGVFAVLYLAVAVALVTAVLEIRERLHVVLAALLLVAHPAWANQFMYDFMADAYPASMLLAALSVYCAKRWRYGFAAGGVFLMLSLALYQSFLAFAVGLSLICIIRHVLADGSRRWKETAVFGGKLLLSGILGMVLYVISVRLSLIYYGGELWDYQGMDEMGRVTFGQLPELVWETYRWFFAGFYRTEPIRINWLYVSDGLYWLYLAISAVMVYLLVRIAVKRKVVYNAFGMAVLAVCIVLLPIGLNISRLTSPNVSIHTLMTNPFVLAVVLVFVLMGACELRDRVSRYAQAGAMVLALLIGGNYVRQSSGMYFVGHVMYEQTYAFYNRLLARIESTPGYEPGVPVAFIGGGSFPLMGASDVLSLELWRISGLSGEKVAVGLGDAGKMNNFIRDYLGIRITPANHEQVEMVLNSEEFWRLAPYPRDGSVEMVRGVLVVKLN
jgi:hypothetical protein